MPHSILAINPSTGFTRVALYRNELLVREQTLRHEEEDLAACPRLADQLDLRARALRGFLELEGIRPGGLQAVVGRGGRLTAVPSGTYRVTDRMRQELADAAHGEDVTNLGGLLARRFADELGAPALVVDPFTVDEMDDLARYSGLAGVERLPDSHTLSIKAVAKRYARELGRPYDELRLVVAHLGAAISATAHRNGRMVDVMNSRDEGPFSTDRAGGLPTRAVVDLCFAPGATAESVRRLLVGDGGLFSYVGTRDLREAVRLAEETNGRSRLAVDALVYQIAKAVGEMATALAGRVDALLITGVLAHQSYVVESLRRRVEWIAPVKVYAGEDELRALTEGALRVLRREEPLREYP